MEKETVANLLSSKKRIKQNEKARLRNRAYKSVVKTEIRKRFECSGSYCTPHHVEMTDHTRNDLRSVLTLQKFKTNAGVPDSFFTVRALQRGN